MAGATPKRGAAGGLDAAVVGEYGDGAEGLGLYASGLA